jgi:transposase
MERSTVHLLHKRGKSLREIASELGRSKNTIARALSEPVDQPPSARRRESSVDAFREQIAEWLQQGLSGVRMLELAREDPDHPYIGGSSVWRAAVRRERLRLQHEQAVADVPIRFEGLPGEYLQVDWGEIRHFPRPTKEGDLEQTQAVTVTATRFVGLDVHRRYATVAAVDSQQEVVLTAQRIDFNDFDEWVRKHLRRTDVVTLEATSNAWHLYDMLVPLVASVTWQTRSRSR